MEITVRSGTPAARLGLAAFPTQDAHCVQRALEVGINFFFFYGANYPAFIAALRDVARTQRDEMILATGSGARTSKGLRAARQKIVTATSTDMLDIFFAEYISPSDDAEKIFGTGGVLDELSRWKEGGAIRYVGATAHDRTLAAQLARDPRVDVLMHRYNMAHRKAADVVFPTALEARTPVIAFTATRWGTLLKSLAEWPNTPPTAADCYRYCLTQSAVRVVLTAPKTVDELQENLGVLESAMMNGEERSTWERFGDLVYEQGQGSAHEFEAKWP